VSPGRSSPSPASLFHQADAILDAALDLSNDDRAGFVERACEGNGALRSLVERLLRAHAREDGVLSGRAIDLAQPLLVQPDEPRAAGPSAPLPGRIGPFRIVRELGRGGMGIVYLAQRDDAPADPPVALKVLRDGAFAGGSALRRFLAERHIVARLEHPHVARLLETGITPDGTPFFAMAHCTGGSLAERLARGPLAVPDAVRIARQLAGALSAAHALGIVHRDVKPANVLFDGTGGAQLTDFGIAKLLDHESTQSGTLIGTPSHLAPEQLRASGVDHRADLWTLGVTLYQMLAGRRPFDGPTYAAVLHAVLSVEPEPLWRVAADVPVALDALVRHLLQKDPDARPQHADEVERALAAIASDPHAAYAPPPTPLTPTVSTPSIRTRPVAVAVLPLVNTGGNPDDAPLSDGLTDELIGALGRVRGIRVTARTTAFALRGKNLDARTVAHMLGVTHLLEGSVRRAGDRLKVSVQLVRAADESVVWSDTYDRQLADVFAVQEEVARAIVAALPSAFEAAEGARLAARPRDIAAYETFLKGRFFMERRTTPDLIRAAEYFEQAVADDPTYAEAYAGLADAHVMLVVFGSQSPRHHLPRVRSAIAEALRQGDGIAAVHASHGNVLSAVEWQWTAAERALQRAIELDPAYVTARLYLSIVLQHLGRCDEAIVVATQGLALDPLSPPLNMTLGRAYLHAGRPAEALRPLQTAIEIAPGFAFAQRQLGDALLLVGRTAEALEALRRAAASNAPNDLGHLAYGLARAGERAEAESIVHGLLAREASGYLPPYGIAAAYAGLDAPDAAMDWLERGFAERAGSMNCVKVAPHFAGMRANPRFVDLLRRMDLLGPPA
jgi:eukaryotic-like serine/threonine-protein kinase